jgi:hypothetical protein
MISQIKNEYAVFKNKESQTRKIYNLAHALIRVGLLSFFGILSFIEL